MHLMAVCRWWFIATVNLNIIDFNLSLLTQLVQHFTTNSDKSDWQVSFPTFQILCRPHSCRSSSGFLYTRLNTFKFYGMSLSWNNLLCPKDVNILLNTDLPAFVLLEVNLYLYYWYLTNSWNLKHVSQRKWIPTRWIQWPQLITNIKNRCRHASCRYWQGHL